MNFQLKEHLINPGGCMMKKYNRKRGYTLIELVAVMAISAIVISIGLTLTINAYKVYFKTINESIREDEIDNALLSIDRLLTTYRIEEIKADVAKKEIEIKDIIAHGETPFNRKIIRCYDSKLVLETHDKISGSSLTNRMPILRDIRDFEIIQKKNLYYYKITLKTGEEIINCI